MIRNHVQMSAMSIMCHWHKTVLFSLCGKIPCTSPCQKHPKRYGPQILREWVYNDRNAHVFPSEVHASRIPGSLRRGSALKLHRLTIRGNFMHMHEQRLFSNQTNLHIYHTLVAATIQHPSLPFLSLMHLSFYITKLMKWYAPQKIFKKPLWCSYTFAATCRCECA